MALRLNWVNFQMEGKLSRAFPSETQSWDVLKCGAFSPIYPQVHFLQIVRNQGCIRLPVPDLAIKHS